MSIMNYSYHLFSMNLHYHDEAMASDENQTELMRPSETLILHDSRHVYWTREYVDSPFPFGLRLLRSAYFSPMVSSSSGLMGLATFFLRFRKKIYIPRSTNLTFSW